LDKQEIDTEYEAFCVGLRRTVHICSQILAISSIVFEFTNNDIIQRANGT
jgi:hypothetical protein